MENKIRTRIHNLIILDESGSMDHLHKATISGCNEVINNIITLDRENRDTQEHFISIYVFQHNSDVKSRYIIKDMPAGDVRPITSKDYEPWGATNLYDAIGATLCDLRPVVKSEEIATGSVTIITDGYENASRFYTLEQVSKMISVLKDEGWNFNFIGANIDAFSVASGIGVENVMQWEASEEGTRDMYDKYRESTSRWSNRQQEDIRAVREMNNSENLSSDEIKKRYIERSKRSAKDFFNDML